MLPPSACAGLWQASQLPFDELRPSLVAAARQLVAAGVGVQVEGTCGFPLCVLRGVPEVMAQQPLDRQRFTGSIIAHRRYLPLCDACARREACFGLRQEYIDRFGHRGLVPFEASTTAGDGDDHG